MRVLFLLALFILHAGAEDFISEFEYGQMLYKDPRGVSCASCHGKVGDGSFIASYIDKEGKKREFYGPDIRGLSLEQFKQSISAGGKIMPKYYLTNKESEAIYKYIQVVNNYMKQEESNTTNDDEEYLDLNSTLLEDNESGQNNNTENSIISKIFKIDEELQ